MLRVFLIILLLIVHFAGPCQHLELSARGAGWGRIQSIEAGKWALFTNVSGLSGEAEWSALAGYRYPFGMGGLQSYGLGVIAPLRPVIGFTMSGFGNDHFRSFQTALAAAKAFGTLSIGIKIRYWQIAITGLQPVNRLTADAGIQVRINTKLMVGGYITNLGEDGNIQDMSIPMAVQTGLVYQPLSTLKTGVEIAYEPGQPLKGKLGLELNFWERLFTRLGINSFTGSTHWGVGFESPAIGIDYSLELHRYLGSIQQAGITYSWL